MKAEIKSIDKPKTTIGIVSEVYKDENTNQICLRFSQEGKELTAWFKKSDILKMFSVDYSNKND